MFRRGGGSTSTARWQDLHGRFDRHKAQIGAAITAANVGFVSVHTAANPTAPALPAQLTYIALAANAGPWQSGLVLAVMLGLIAAYAVGVMPLLEVSISHQSQIGPLLAEASF